jgi:type II secretory pathway predicted ATPase ExeA/tetratricopeptide (TPR) repeat protein
MYRAHYNLRERPFEISTDTRFLWMGEKHKEALAMLKYGVLARKGFLLLTGDVGTGKTTLVNALLESLNENTLVANITDPLLEPLEFFNFIAASFGMGERFDNKVDFLLRFAEFLRRENEAGKNVLLILDEAHRFSKDLLEQFRLLSNIELPERKLINMFLVGQNEFNRTLMSTDCRALRQRITLTYNIKPLSESETLEYIRYRLKVAGTEEEIFHRKAVGEVYRFSQGYPRLINIICDHALLTGFVRQAKKITPTIIKECSQELCLMGDTIRISSSDFFDSEDSPTPSSESTPDEAGPPPGNVPGPANAEVPAKRLRDAKPQGDSTLETRKNKPSLESRPGIVEHKESRSRYWVVAACVAFMAVISALLFQKDRLPGIAQIDPTASATIGPGPETVTLPPEEPLAMVRRDGKLAPAKRSTSERVQEEIGKGNVDQAVKLLEDAIAKTPADLPRLRELYSETLCRQAGELSDRGEPGAEQLLVKAVEADPKNKQAYFDLGKIYTKEKRYPEAVRAYRKAADLDDRSADTFFNLGFVYSASGDNSSAEKMFLRVAALRPPYLDKALFNLAAVQCKQEKRQQCVETLEEALAENPNNQRARTYLSQLKLHAKGSR